MPGGLPCATSPVPVSYVPLARNSGLGPALDEGLAASWFDVVARMDADDVAMPHRFEVELPLIAGRGHRRGRAARVRRRTPMTSSGSAFRPPTRPDPALRPDARSVQPPDRRLPAARGARGGRLRRVSADGGLRAVRQDAGRRRPGGQRGRAAGVLPRRPRGLQAAGRDRAAALRAAAAARVPAARVHHPGRVRAQRAGSRRLPADPVVVPPRDVPADRRPLHRACRSPRRRWATPGGAGGRRNLRMGGWRAGCLRAEWEYPEMPAAGFWREQPLPVGS